MSSDKVARCAGPVLSHQADHLHLRASRRSERGLSLVIAIGFIAALGVVIAAILAYASASSASQSAYRTERARRYSGDAAIEQAVFWAKGQPKVALDPAAATPDPCILKVPAVAATATKTATPAITVTCSADPGSGSGLPKDPGYVPDYSILTLGQRDKEVRPFSGSSCVFETGKKNYDSALGSLSTLGTARAEFGIRFSKTTAVCVATRPVNQWTVRGKVFSNSPIVANPGGSIKPADANSSITARGGCQNINACISIARSNSDPMDPGVSMEGHDPRTGDCTSAPHIPPGATVTDGITRAEYCASWNLPDISALPAGVVPSASLCGPGKVVVFEPGHYSDISALNNLFKDGRCKATTFWFAPARGTDGQLLGAGYKTGLYYFDFTSGSGGGCNWYNSSGSTNHQWCIGNAYDFNQHVVAGTPKGWDPFGSGGGAVATASMTNASVDGLRTSLFWNTSGGKANKIDGVSASYNNPIVATNRNITLKDFGPKVSSGAYTGVVNIKVAHSEGSGFNTPQITVRYDSTLFGSKTCGTFNLNKGGYPASSPDQLSLGDQQTLGDCLNQGDKINGVSVTFTVGGCNFFCFANSLSLDGMAIEPGNYPNQPTFPRPVSPSDTGGDCDPSKPGAMFIFGGDSHVYVADGALEVCAGLAPYQGAARQEIGVYGVPATLPLRATSAAQTAKGGNTTGVNGTTQATRIAEQVNTNPGLGLEMGDWGNISYSGGNCGFCAPTIRGGMDLNFPGFDLSKYPGTRVKRVLARASYNSNGFASGPQLEVPCSSGTQTYGLDPSINFGEWLGSVLGIVGQQSKFRQQTVDVTGCMGSRVTGGAFTATFWARGQYVCGFWICSNRSFEDQLEGVEFTVELEKNPSATGVIAVPQNGCITGQPNYWNTERGGENDCAIIKADQTKNNPSTPDSRGRFSIKGTVYAPSAAIDVDDEDVLYPFFSRGLVARTLMLRGFKYRIDTPVGDIPTLDKSQNPREATFTACIRAVGRENATTACDSLLGDKVLSRARVRFEIQTNWSDPTTRARVPKIQWWNVNR